MSAITWTDVTNYASELSGVSLGAQTGILALANARFDPAALDGENGPETRLARVLLAAHLATVGPASGGSASAGPVIEEEVGDVRRKFADLSSSASTTSFEGSSYGDLLTRLLRINAPRWWVA